MSSCLGNTLTSWSEGPCGLKARHRRSCLKDPFTLWSEGLCTFRARHRRSCLRDPLTSWPEGPYSLGARHRRSCLRDSLTLWSEGGTCSLGHRLVCDLPWRIEHRVNKPVSLIQSQVKLPQGHVHSIVRRAVRPQSQAQEKLPQGPIHFMVRKALYLRTRHRKSCLRDPLTSCSEGGTCSLGHR